MAKKLKDLPVGAKVYRPNSKFLGEPVVFQVAHKKNDRIKLITKDIVALRAFDAMEPKNSNSDRRSYGNNRWLHSNIRQYLNVQGIYRFAPQHDADQAPTKEYLWNGHNPYEGTPGFLAGFEDVFVESILPSDNLTAVPSTDGGGSEVVTDKVYLPSITEVGLENDTGVKEGEKWSLFTNNSSRVAHVTSAAAKDSTYDVSAGEERWYLTRTHQPHTSSYVYDVSTKGYLSYAYARDGNGGLRPALDLSPDISVSDNPNSDGVYTLEFNAAPDIITSTSTNIGDKNTPFSVNYTVTDGDNDKVKVVEKLNNTTLRTIDSITLGEQQTIKITESQWRALPTNEQSTITITADDGQESTTKTFTFVKRNNAPLVTLDTKDNEVFYEGSTLNISGTATDADVGDAVIVKYKLASSRERVITTQVSTGEAFDYGKVLTFTKGRFYDGETVVTDVLAEGNTYTLEVWAQDDKGVNSPVQKRKFTVVPNRSPLLEITETPNVEGAALSTDLSIKGTVNDPDGDDVRLTYKLNNGKEIPVAESDNSFEISFKLSDLKQGRNTFLVIARDEYDAMTTKEVQVTTMAVKSPTDHIESKLYYTIDTKGVETDGILVWLRRPIGDDTDYKGYVSITQTGATEDYQAMEKTTSIVQGHNRDELIGSVGEKGADVRLKLEFDGDEAPIQMLQGVIK